MARVVFDAPIPDDVTVEAELRFGTPRHACDHRTWIGWKYALATEADGTFVAIYAFLDHEAVVRARGPHDQVLAVLRSARPDWTSDDVIALAQLWEP